MKQILKQHINVIACSLLLTTLIGCGIKSTSTSLKSEEAPSQSLDGTLYQRLVHNNVLTFKGSSQNGECELKLSRLVESKILEVTVSSDKETDLFCKIGFKTLDTYGNLADRDFVSPTFKHKYSAYDRGCNGFSQWFYTKTGFFDVEKNLLSFSYREGCLTAVGASDVNEIDIQLTRDRAWPTSVKCYNRSSGRSAKLGSFTCNITAPETSVASTPSRDVGIYFAEKYACNSVTHIFNSNTFESKKYFCNGIPSILEPTGFNKNALDLCVSKCSSNKDEPNACDQGCRDRFHTFCTTEICQ